MKRVTACHGVGRKPEDGKRLHIIELRLLSPVSRVPYFLLPNEGLTPLAMDMTPTNVGYKFRSPTARKLVTKFQFVVESKQYSLIAGAILCDRPLDVPLLMQR